MGYFSVKFYLTALVVWQFFSVLLMALGVWPYELAWVNFALLTLFVLRATSYHSLLLFMVSIPFFVALPNPYFESLSLWRLLAIAMFSVWSLRGVAVVYREGGRSWIRSVIGWCASVRFAPWDKYLGLFAVIALAVTLVFAKFPIQGIMQLLFFLNAYLVYVVAVNSVKERDQLVAAIKYAVAGLLTIIATGYTQLVSTFFTSLDTFWVYWASFVSRLYYGEHFSQVALYSNSWFSYTGARDLRMFSIMPDSQSFGYLCVFALGLLAVLAAYVKKGKIWLWTAFAVTALAVVFSGTRAVWVGVVLPFSVLLVMAALKKNLVLGKKALGVLALVVILFAVAPVVKSGLAYLRTGDAGEDVTDRVQSIYNLKEASNAGRVLIWKDSLRYGLMHPQGVGLDNFLVSLVPNADSSSYGELAGDLNERYNLPQEYVSAHSLYLQILVELGLLGLVAFVAFIFFYFKSVWEFLKKLGSGNDFLTLMVVQSAVVVLWFLASAMFDITLLNDRVLLYFFFLLALDSIIIGHFKKVIS